MQYLVFVIQTTPKIVQKTVRRPWTKKAFQSIKNPVDINSFQKIIQYFLFLSRQAKYIIKKV